MINTISVYVTDFGEIELPPELMKAVAYEEVPMGEDGHLLFQPMELPVNPTFWAYIKNQTELLKAELSDIDYTERRRAQQ